MARTPKREDIMTDHEHHQAGAEPAKPEHNGLERHEQAGKGRGESEGVHDNAAKKSSDGDREL